MTDPQIVLVGRSSSPFTRITRIFALELELAHSFRPVLDITTTNPATYADNPALKVPILVDGSGSLFGTENICRELVRRSETSGKVVLRGDIAHRLVANAEELVLHALGTEVILIMLGLGGVAQTPPKLRASLENSLAFLDANIEDVVSLLPPGRVLSFCEVSLFCLVTHLPFRQIMDPSGYRRLQAFCERFGERASARATPYRFDAP